MTKYYTWVGGVETAVYWEVGNGNDIDIWRDRWIPRPDSLRAIPSGVQSLSNRLIDYIDWAFGVWRTELIREIFAPCDAKVILNMKLYDPTKQDELRWFYSKDGFFSVRSAYRFILKREIDFKKVDGAFASSTSAVEAKWKKMWSLNIQPRVQSFLWRPCKRILPTKVNLAERIVCADNECDVCGTPELELHVLGHCIEVKKFWRFLPKQAKWISQAATMTELLDYMCNVGKPEEMEILAVVSSCIWRARNLRLFEGKESNLRELVAKCQASFISKPVNITKWKKPIEGVVKVNCDAAVSKNNGRDIGFESSGESAFHGAKIVNFSEEAEWAEAEAEAVLWAMEESRKRGYDSIIVESNGLALISKLMKNCRWKGFYGWILEKIYLMKSEFSTCLWSHIGRDGNQPAHLLASLRPNVLLADFSCSFTTLLNNFVSLDSH
ncbi:LOW QUALITY PROTEIN: hypothetical protein V2J09_009773 [Rumex salicifolius]